MVIRSETRPGGARRERSPKKESLGRAFFITESSNYWSMSSEACRRPNSTCACMCVCARAFQSRPIVRHSLNGRTIRNSIYLIIKSLVAPSLIRFHSSPHYDYYYCYYRRAFSSPFWFIDALSFQSRRRGALGAL